MKTQAVIRSTSGRNYRICGSNIRFEPTSRPYLADLMVPPRHRPDVSPAQR